MSALVGLPAYSGATACPKCTCEFIRSTYVPACTEVTVPMEVDPESTTIRVFNDLIRLAKTPTESMIRTCHDCGYGWLEQTADAPSGTF